MVLPRIWKSRLTPLKLTDKPETAGEPCSELPAQPRDVLYPDLSGPKLYGAGHVHGAGYDAAHCLTPPGSPCVCYNSGLGEGLNGSSHNCKIKPPVAPMMFEEAL